MLAPTTITVTTEPQNLIGAMPKGGAVLINNVGGLDLAGKYPGPDDAIITVREGAQAGQSFPLLSGDSMTLRGANITAIYAAAVTGTTTLAVFVGSPDC